MKYYKLKVLKDNYIWILVSNNTTIAIDCGCAEGLIDFLNTHQLKLNYILITHAHNDHIDGLAKIKEYTSAKIICGARTKCLLNCVSNEVIVYEEEFKIDNFTIKAIATPGHTEDHMCYYFTPNKWLFCGDTLFSLGCGRAFFNLELLYISLQNLVKLCDRNTLIFPGHDYFNTNLDFLNSIDYFKFKPKETSFNNKKIIPTYLSYELQYNPFLNVHKNSFKKFLEKENLNDFEFFSYLRGLKDKF